jgi:hypothetical protein
VRARKQGTGVVTARETSCCPGSLNMDQSRRNIPS